MTRRFAAVKFLLALALLFPVLAVAQEAAETRELIGQLSSRRALVVLTSNRLPDGTFRVSGEYLLLATMQRRFLEGERSPRLGVTTLREGATPIFFGRPVSATLQGTWRDGVFKGTRLGPGGQVRERFEFSETFPEMSAHAATLACEAGDSAYSARLDYVIEGGRLKPGTLGWRAKVEPSGHSCAIDAQLAVDQTPLDGGLRFVIGGARRNPCAVTLRDLGDFVRVSADNCGAYCGSGAYFEPMLVDSRGRCQLLRPQSR